MRHLGLILAAFAIVVSPAEAKASKGYTTKGHHRARAGNFRVQFSGEGTWTSAYHAASDTNGISTATTFDDESSFKWDWEQNPRRETLMIPASCGGAFNQCKTIVPGASLVKGRQSLSYKVDDTILSPPDPAQTAACSDSLTLGSTGATDAKSIGITIKHSSDGRTLTFSQLSETPLTEGDGGFLDQGTCKGLDAEELWRPGGDGSVSTRPASSFFAFRTVEIPTHLLQTSDTIVIGVSGPSAGHEPARNCGISDTTVTCVQKGSWTGKITLTRVHPA